MVGLSRFLYLNYMNVLNTVIIVMAYFAAQVIIKELTPRRRRHSLLPDTGCSIDKF